MVKWFCSSALCYNNYNSKDASGQPLSYYRLPRDESTQSAYRKIFKTTGMNWEKGHICSAHWSSGKRQNTKDLPNIVIPADQFEKIKQIYEAAQDLISKYKNPTEKLKTQLKNAKRKYELALQIIASPGPSHSSRTPVERHYNSTPLIKKRSWTPSKKVYQKKLNKLENELKDAHASINILERKLRLAEQEISKLKQNEHTLNKKLKHSQKQLSENKNKEFTHQSLIAQPDMFHYLCGLSIEQFDIILQCALPYIHLIPYPDCAGNLNRRSFDTATELLIVLTICRHGLHQGVMGYVVRKSKATVQRIFIGWVIFLATIFNEIDLKPPSGFMLQKMPDIFVKTGHGLTDLVIDATEFKFQQATKQTLN